MPNAAANAAARTSPAGAASLRRPAGRCRRRPLHRHPIDHLVPVEYPGREDMIAIPSALTASCRPKPLYSAITKWPSADSRMPRQKISSDCWPHSTSGRSRRAGQKAGGAAAPAPRPARPARRTAPAGPATGRSCRPATAAFSSSGGTGSQKPCRVQLTRTMTEPTKSTAAIGIEHPQQPAGNRGPASSQIGQHRARDEQELPGERVEKPDMSFRIGRHRDVENLHRDVEQRRRHQHQQPVPPQAEQHRRKDQPASGCTSAGCRETPAGTAAAAP